MLASAFLARFVAMAASGVLAVRFGALLRRRLLEGALRLSAEARHRLSVKKRELQARYAVQREMIAATR